MFSPALREKDESLPVQKLATIENPFSRTSPKEKIVAVPAINPDVTIIHAQAADAKGTVRIDGLTFSDVEQAKAARYLIVTCETLVGEGILNQSPQNNQIPGFCVDAVVHQPFGAYPTACYGQYDYDPGFLDWYRDNAYDQAGFAAYMKECIMNSTSHDQFIKKVSGNRMETLMADPETGYSLKVQR